MTIFKRKKLKKIIEQAKGFKYSNILNIVLHNDIIYVNTKMYTYYIDTEYIKEFELKDLINYLEQIEQETTRKLNFKLIQGGNQNG